MNGVQLQHRSYELEVKPEGFLPKSLPEIAFTLTQASAGEGSRCRRLWTEVGRGYWTERVRWSGARWRRYLERPAISFWIASAGGRDIGFFELRNRGSNTKLEGFGLLPSWRGKRLGGALLSAATEQAFASGARRVWLHTATDDHPNALPNYKARGYRIYREGALRNPVRS